MRGEAAAAEFAGRSFVLVDWYLRLACGKPDAVVNETCSWLVFDAHGLLDPHAAHAIDAAAMPTDAQWARVRALVFGNARTVSENNETDEPTATTEPGTTP
ncbi:hypothetical protein BH11PSE7_BH11PSE7_17660 [soil metagenome]